MLMNILELTDWLNKHMDFWSIQRETSEWDRYTPIKYEGIYERIGHIVVWNEVGSIEHTFYMYRPVGGGTVVYDVE